MLLFVCCKRWPMVFKESLLVNTVVSSNFAQVQLYTSLRSRLLILGGWVMRCHNLGGLDRALYSPGSAIRHMKPVCPPGRLPHVS